MDTLSQYFHIITNTVILYFAINVELSLFMAFNICCIVIFYVYSSIKLNHEAKKSDTQVQIELNIEDAQEKSRLFKR